MADTVIGSVAAPWSQEAIESKSNTTTATQNNNLMGKDAFLKLLFTQLQYQNPLEPVKDTDFIAQMAQFTSLEQVSNINTSIESLVSLLSTMQQSSIYGTNLNHAFSLVGQEIEFMVGEDKIEKGIVTGFKTSQGVPYLTVGEYLVPLENICSVQQVQAQGGGEGTGQSTSEPTTDPIDQTESDSTESDSTESDSTE